MGIKTLEGNASFTNLLGKAMLSKLNFEKDARIYILLRRVYRSPGKFKKIQRSYSAFGEDQVLAKYLPELNGSYTDVGAAGPIKGSNTYLFYERGWRGITVEPISALIMQHKKFRPADTQIQAYVSNQPGGEIVFYQYVADDFSTNSRERVADLEKVGIFPQLAHKVPNILLSELAYKANPLMPTLLNVDVEGAELSVLMSNNWDLYTPRVIAIEEWSSPIYKKTSVRIFLEELNFSLVSRCFLTSIYVHQSYLETLAVNGNQEFGWFKS